MACRGYKLVRVGRGRYGISQTLSKIGRRAPVPRRIAKVVRRERDPTDKDKPCREAPQDDHYKNRAEPLRASPAGRLRVLCQTWFGDFNFHCQILSLGVPQSAGTGYDCVITSQSLDVGERIAQRRGPPRRRR